MGQIGLRDSVFDHIPFYGQEQDNFLTAQEANLALAQLWWGQLYSSEWTEYTLRVLRNSSTGLNYIIPGQLPAGVQVGHKIGYHWDVDGWVQNNVGIVSWTNGTGETRAFAISIFTSGAPAQWHSNDNIGAEISRMVYDWFAAQYATS
jgi:hypothetical protein